MSTPFQEAEKDGLTKLVHIPFANQDSQFVQLLKRYKGEFTSILNSLHTQLHTPISFNIEEEIQTFKGMFAVNTGWNDHLGVSRQVTNKMRAYRLIHLKPHGFSFSDDGIVSLVCEYDSKGLDKYIPASIKALHTTNDKLFKELMGHTSLDQNELWWFTPFAYIVPCIGGKW